MSKFDEAMEKYKKHLGEITSSADHDLLEKVAKGLGPSIYNNDASKVSCSDQSELERVAKNYCEKKLGITDHEAAMKAIATVCGKYDSRTKYRAVFYYLVCKELKKESVYA
jgi:hypothetical protein